MSSQDLQYTPLSAQAEHDLLESFKRDASSIKRNFPNLPLPEGNTDGEVEVIGRTEVVHRFADAPGDSETIRWHFVEAGRGEPVVFLHGVPASWYTWHHQIDALAENYHVVAVDLKGYGQSDKKSGDYRHEGVAEQLLALLDQVGLKQFNLVGHDRGAVLADYLTGNHPERILRYVRGEQHLFHFNPVLAPQEHDFITLEGPLGRALKSDPQEFIALAYVWLTQYPERISDSDWMRTIQEWSYPGIRLAFPRYFNSSSFRKEWIDRRTRLMKAWNFPMLILQGYHSARQPNEFYVDVKQYLPNADVKFVDSGHFWMLENPEETTHYIAEFLSSPL